jgi:hypothetical protein
VQLGDDRARESRLPGPQRPAERDDITCAQRARETACEALERAAVVEDL